MVQCRTPTGTPTSPIPGVFVGVRPPTRNARTCRNSTPTNTDEPIAWIWGSSGRVFKPCQLLTCGMWESQPLTDNQIELQPAWSHRSWREWHDRLASCWPADFYGHRLCIDNDRESTGIVEV
jgi:hypothetical protein